MTENDARGAGAGDRAGDLPGERGARELDAESLSARALGSEIARAAGDIEWEAWVLDEAHSPMWHRFRALLAELVRRASDAERRGA